mmetsp:Transcript_47672/g.54899  ORF Transcript_47672/g.54899 Transcript_47672/m.54899 type:complete len:692 (+) Transcript_47672:76-2151(+)
MSSFKGNRDGNLRGNPSSGLGFRADERKAPRNSKTKDQGWSRSAWGNTVKEQSQGQGQSQTQGQTRGSESRSNNNQGSQQQNYPKKSIPLYVEPKDIIKLSRDIIVSKFSRYEVPDSMKVLLEDEDANSVVSEKSVDAEFANVSQIVFADCLNERKPMWHEDETKLRGPLRKERKFGGGSRNYRKPSDDRNDENRTLDYQSNELLSDEAMGRKANDLWDDPWEDDGNGDEGGLHAFLTLPQDKESLMKGLDMSEFEKSTDGQRIRGTFDILEEIQKEDRERQSEMKEIGGDSTEADADQKTEIDLANEQLQRLVLGKSDFASSTTATTTTTSITAATATATITANTTTSNVSNMPTNDSNFGGMGYASQFQNQAQTNPQLYGQGVQTGANSGNYPGGYGSSNIGNLSSMSGYSGLATGGSNEGMSGNQVGRLNATANTGSQGVGLSQRANQGNTAAAAAADKQWYYKDPAGLIRGPFTTKEMNYWHSQGYFDNELLVSCNQTTEFYPLKMYRQRRSGNPGQGQNLGSQPAYIQGQNMMNQGASGMGSSNPNQGMQRGTNYGSATSSGMARGGYQSGQMSAMSTGGAEMSNEERMYLQQQQQLQYRQYMAQQQQHARDNQELQRQLGLGQYGSGNATTGSANNGNMLSRGNQGVSYAEMANAGNANNGNPRSDKGEQGGSDPTSELKGLLGL